MTCRQLWSLALLLLLLLFRCGRGNQQPEKITRTAGEWVSITFNLENSTKVIKSISLYKDSGKIGQCLRINMNCTYSRGTLKTISQQIIVTIKNLTVNDSGKYYVAFFLESRKDESVITSKEVFLTVGRAMFLGNNLTDSHNLTGNIENADQETSASRTSSYVYIIYALAFSFMTLPAVLLSWFFLSPKRSSRQELPSSAAIKDEYQVTDEASRAAAIRSTEYEVLEFPTATDRKDKAGRSKENVDSVEYATITFSLINTRGTLLGHKTSHWTT